jgi:Fur family transcriptional regulator, ferric uptake regulator
MQESPTPRRRRSTPKGQVVLETLRGSDRFRSAQQLYVQIRHETSLQIGLASVYRILRGLADDGIAETQRAEDGEMLYRLVSSTEHRHYLLCRRCGRSVGFALVALEDSAADLVRLHGYSDVTHHFDLYGICPQCRKATGTPSVVGDASDGREDR